jgi:hypothetical protein
MKKSIFVAALAAFLMCFTASSAFAQRGGGHGSAGGHGVSAGRGVSGGRSVGAGNGFRGAAPQGYRGGATQGYRGGAAQGYRGGYANNGYRGGNYPGNFRGGLYGYGFNSGYANYGFNYGWYPWGYVPSEMSVIAYESVYDPNCGCYVQEPYTAYWDGYYGAYAYSFRGGLRLWHGRR